MYRYPYTEDKEPEQRKETREEKFVRKSKRAMNIVFSLFGIALLILLVVGIAIKYSNGSQSI